MKPEVTAINKLLTPEVKRERQNVMLPPALRKRAHALAKRSGISFSRLVVLSLEAMIALQEPERKNQHVEVKP